MHFTKDSRCIIYGTHLGIAQNMLDYDYLCDRWPSVAAFFSTWEVGKQYKLFYGDKEFFLPTINNREAVDSFENIDTLINLASFRSCSNVNKEALASQKFKNIFTIAEGVAEREIREIITLASQQEKTTMFGPSIVWWLISQVFRIGHTGGSLDNIVKSRLYQAWNVAIVSKSWWMMNELCRIVSSRTNWVHTALQVWWDRFLMTTFQDIVKYFETQDEIKMIVLLWEVWNKDELIIADMVQNWEITKPIVAWCIGDSAEKLTSEVQFGHAWAKANSKEEKALYKNNYLRQAGVSVPDNFDDLGNMIQEVYTTNFWPLKIPSSLPLHLQQKIDILRSRRKTRFTSTISNEKSDELTYNWKPISTFVQDQSLTKVIWHLRLKKELPEYACNFLTTALILLADHGPAVSGATNTIITARAGKDLVSSLIAWLATIWPRFWGAIDGAAKWLFTAIRDKKSAWDIIFEHKKQWAYIQWIGHKVKSKYNPDKRCLLLDEIAKTFSYKKHFLLAKDVESLTLEKKPTLILNVDWYIAAMFLDIMTDIWLSHKEIEQYINAWLFNWFFVIARSIWLIGHYLDQQRLQEWLYRTSREDILYQEENS